MLKRFLTSFVFVIAAISISCARQDPLSISGVNVSGDGSMDYSTGASRQKKQETDKETGSIDGDGGASGNDPAPNPPLPGNNSTTPPTGGGSTTTGSTNSTPTPQPTPEPEPLPNCAVSGVNEMNISNAPASYGLAVHPVATHMRLGALVYASSDPYCVNLDNDGVVFPTTLRFGVENSFIVYGSGGGATLTVWIDFNADGVFDAISERTFNGGVPTTGAIKMNFPSNPTGRTSVTTWARFRYGPAGISPTVQANIGEVEDYQITIVN